MYRKRYICPTLTPFCPNSRPDPKMGQNGQGLVEGVVVIGGILLVIFVGMSFAVKCNLIKLRQQMALREGLYTLPSEIPERKFSLKSAMFFFQKTACS